MLVVREIAAIGSSMSDEAKRERYAEFMEAFPSLFGMACEGRVDVEMLKTMLRLRKRLTKNKLSEEDAYKAVGETLTRKFVDPSLGGAAGAQDDAAPLGGKRPRSSS